MNLSEIEIKELLRRQKCYNAAVKLHELLEEAEDEAGEIRLHARNTTTGYDETDEIIKEIEKLRNMALELCSNIFSKPSYV
jgi:hypothetical protein